MPTNGAYNWSPGLVFGATCAIFKAGAVPGAPGARRGAQGAENRPKTRGRIYHFILTSAQLDRSGAQPGPAPDYLY